MLLHWSKKFEAYQSEQQMKNGEDVDDCNTSGTPSPQLPFFLELVELVDTPPANFLSPWQLSGLVWNWGFFSKEKLADSGRDHFCTLNLNPGFGLVQAPLIDIEAVGWSKWRSLVSLWCDRKGKPH